MKWTITILTIAVLQILHLSYAQSVSFSGKKVPLEKIFAVIKSQTGYVFFSDVSLLKQAKPVTVQLKNAPLEKALNEIFKDQPITWVMENKIISIIKKPGQITGPQTQLTAVAPFIQVKGIVTDAEGYPMDYVSVQVKGSNKGSLTDKNGTYSIQVRKEDMIVYSSVGYGTKEIRPAGTEVNVSLQQEQKPMEVLVIGGNMGARKRKADATSITVIDSKTLEKLPVNTLDQVFKGLVPGANSFDPGDAPEGISSLSFRGASSYGPLAPIAVYVDGIEYAGGSDYLSQLDKTNIDRIEVVRGPAAATMYGTGSNGGIIQIYTKKGRPGKTSLNLTTSAGFYKSKWVEKDPFQQMHNLETVTGFKNAVITLGGSYRTINAYLPDGGEKNKGFYAGAKFSFGKLQANLVARYNNRNFGISRNPSFDTAIHPRTDIIIEPYAGYTTPAYEWFNVRPRPSINKRGLTETYITGINLSHKTTANWVNNLDAGYTSNNWEELPVLNGTIPLQRQYYANKNNVTTLRYYNVLNLANTGSGFAAVISSGAEYKKYSTATSYTRAPASVNYLGKDPDNENYGAFVQATPSYKNIYLTMGMRYEKNKLFDAAWNPRIGLTTNFESRSLIFKPKISWGRGITAPPYQSRYGQPPNQYTVVYANPHIRPQAQQGFDYGFEMYDQKGRFQFEVIRYDNVIKDIIAQVSLGQDKIDTNLSAYTYTNVAAIANQGWEFSGGYQVRRFSLAATYAIINTTVKDTSGASSLSSFGGKGPGSRMYSLPTHTAGVNLTYNFFRVFSKTDGASVSLNLTEADGVKATDNVAYYMDVAYGRTPYVPGRYSYEVETTPVFRLGLNADYFITNELRFFVQGSNILNSYKFEYYSDYPTHGATWLFGFKYNLTKDK